MTAEREAPSSGFGRRVARPGRVGPGRQLAALLQLRWQMVRTPGVRLAAVVGVGVLVWLLVLTVRGTRGVQPAALEAAVTLAPQAFLGFAVLALIAPLTAGGGNEVVPPAQLVAYPIRPGTLFLGGLVLAPVNLVWVVQLLVLAAETAVLTVGGSIGPGLVTSGIYVGCLTALGQAVAWTVAGLRQTARGRRLVAVVAVALVIAAVVAGRSGEGGALLAASPTRTVVDAVVAGGAGDLVTWARTTGVLLAATLAALALGARSCAWALRRPGDAGAQHATGALRRRRGRRSALAELVAVDRASIWRAPALRRGGLVLAVLPGVAAAGARIPWQSVIVLPGLVAAGAGLLFGINSFCLDGSGALWLASLPHDPLLAARAKLIVLTETVFGAVVLTAVAGSLRSPGTPSGTDIAAAVASALACTVLVVSACLRLSVAHPHRADLLGKRDAVAPPGALTVASIRLAVPAAAVGLALSAAARTGQWWWPPLVALPVLVLGAHSLRRSLSRYADPVVRGRIMSAVSAG